MIGSLRGKAIERQEDSVLVEVGGVGYLVLVPLRDLPAYAIGNDVFLYTSMQVREDSMQLFGFLDRDDEGMFKMLLGVSKVGPKVALAVLSTLATQSLKQAIMFSDVQAISAVPGIGKKTAERILLELKEKIGSLEEEFTPVDSGSTVAQANATTNAVIDARTALAGLGYSSQEIEKALAGTRDEITPESGAEEILKLALAQLK